MFTCTVGPCWEIVHVLGEILSPIDCNDRARFSKHLLISIVRVPGDRLSKIELNKPDFSHHLSERSFTLITIEGNMKKTVVGGNPTSTWKHIAHIQRQVSRVVSTLASTYCLTQAPSTSAAASWVIHLTSLKLNMFLSEKLGSVVLRVRLTKWVHKL